MIKDHRCTRPVPAAPAACRAGCGALSVDTIDGADAHRDGHTRRSSTVSAIKREKETISGKKRFPVAPKFKSHLPAAFELSSCGSLPHRLEERDDGRHRYVE